MYDKNLKFDIKRHEYSYRGKKLQGVTSFIKKYFNEFDEKAVARKLAKFPNNKSKKHGVRYFLREWKKARDDGTQVHKEIDLFIKAGVEPKHFKAKAACTYISNLYRTLGEPVQDSELQLCDIKLGLAGTIDCVISTNVKKEDSIQRELMLIDWKTNKEIKMKSYNNEMAKEPITHLPDCNYSSYCLQLSLYAYMLERMGYKIGELKLVHLTDIGGTMVYNIPYMRKEVEMITNDKHNKKGSRKTA